MTATQYHTLPDRRRLAYCVYGDPAGDPVFYNHSGPGSRLQGELFHEQARQHGLRLIAVDRPGQGRSDYSPGYRLLDFPRDLKALANALDLERFGVLGWSGGGPPTVACVADMPERLDFAIVIGSYTNLGAFPQGIELLPRADRTALRLGQASPLLLRLFFKLLQWYVRLAPQAYARWVQRNGNATDQALLEDVYARRLLVRDAQEALQRGVAGVSQEAQLQYQDWGFSLAQVGVRLHVFHGTEDPFAPFALGEHLAASVPDGVLHVFEGQGHFLPLDQQTAIFGTVRAELQQAIHDPTIPHRG
jgi:pimeloyl-ACP methyl ester carboxylesterase